MCGCERKDVTEVSVDGGRNVNVGVADVIWVRDTKESVDGGRGGSCQRLVVI